MSSSKTQSAVPETDICADYVICLLREIRVKVECCLYIVISNKYDNNTCILSMVVRQVDVVYAYVNQALFLNIVATRKLWCSKISLKNTLLVMRRLKEHS